VLVKGGDYQTHDIVGAQFVKSRGGRVVTVPLVNELSGPQLLQHHEPHDGGPHIRALEQRPASEVGADKSAADA
jgi:hypothetical protein